MPRSVIPHIVMCIWFLRKWQTTSQSSCTILHSQLQCLRDLVSLCPNQYLVLSQLFFFKLVVQSPSHLWLFAPPWTVARQASRSFTISQSLLKLNVHWVGDASQPSHSLSPPSPPAFNLSQDQSLLQWVGSSHQVAKVLKLHSAPGLPKNIQSWSL